MAVPHAPALQVVATGAVSSGEDVQRFIKCTLLNAHMGFDAVTKATLAALFWLRDHQFIMWVATAQPYFRDGNRYFQLSRNLLDNSLPDLVVLITHLPRVDRGTCPLGKAPLAPFST